jgi:hypothetical protein
MKQPMLVLAAIMLLALACIVIADPEGGTVTFVTNTTKDVTAATSRTDSKGSITTITISSIQQNTKWKAYIGNVTGTLVLRDADDYSIYEWSAIASPSGEVYMTRNSTIDWSTAQCANLTNIQTEQSKLGHGSSASDNIANTFSSTIHQSFIVAGRTINNGTCRSAFTWINNSAQTPSQNARFQELLLMDANLRIVYTTIISQDTGGYRNATMGNGSRIYDRNDFQAILPDTVSASNARYYFYVEIDG